MDSTDLPTTSSVPPEEQDALWSLLGASLPPPAPSRFAADALRAIRREPAPGKSRDRPFWLAWGLGVPALAAAVALALAILHRPVATPPSEELAEFLPQEQVEILAEELHLMTYVDELLAVSDPALLDDDGLAELLF